jgi:hypothetical protein
MKTVRPPAERDFTSRLRSPAVAARVGVWLGVCFGVCFVTGLISHYAQAGSQPVPFPTSPAWGYRVTQGLHVLSGIAAVPLLLVKLWSVYPALFRPLPRRVRSLALDVAEKGSIALLVSSAIFMLATGLANSGQWYPWAFSFRATHYAVAWVAIGSLVVHIAVKLPVIRQALGADVESSDLDRPEATDQGALSRRGVVRTALFGSVVAVLATAGGSVPWLRRLSVLAVTTGDGPGGVPINRTLAEAGIDVARTGEAFRLTVAHAGRETTFTREDLESLPQHTEVLPIACVEGWSATGTWTGVRLRELLDLAGAPAGRDVRVRSLQTRYAFGTSLLWANFADDDRTLLALGLDGEPLSLDHGFPCRIIAPNRPGVRQTKWVERLEVL